VTRLVGGGGGQMEAEKATNESSQLVGGSRGQGIGRRKPPTSRRDSLVVVEGRWRRRKPPTSRRDSLVVLEGRE
jgi:hypothetical protein